MAPRTAPELPEVWCANDARPATVFALIARKGIIEPRALCGDCWWKAQSAARIADVWSAERNEHDRELDLFLVR